MINVDFFGCSFTESPKLPYTPLSDKFDIELYSMHCQVTKPISGFLEFDVAYNNQTDFRINNYGKGSFGNFTIKNVISNKVHKLNKADKNLAIVQLSALLRTEHSWQGIQDKDRYYDDTENVFDIDFNEVRPDYFVEGVLSMNEFYQKHLNNLNNIIELLKDNYDDYIIFFGWDISTPDFDLIANESNLYDIIKLYPYEYSLSKIEYFENMDSYNYLDKTYKGMRGGLLEYSSNKLPEEIRYVSEKDHHPSYFSNKIFYVDVIKPFIQKHTNIDNTYFDENKVIQFEEFLKSLYIKKLKGGEWCDYEYSSLQMEIIKYIRTNILKNE